MALPNNTTISLNQVNVELGRSGTANINMNDSALRSLFGRAGSGTSISMSDGWGKTTYVPGSQFFTGSGTFNVPSYVSSVTIAVVGGGGGGGSHIGGGGGGGGIVYGTVGVTPSSSISISIGGGGGGKGNGGKGFGGGGRQGQEVGIG